MDKARAHIDQSFARSRILEYVPSVAFAYSGAAVVHAVTRDTVRLAATGDAMLALAREQKLPYWVTSGMVYSGLSRTQAGQATEGLAMIKEGLSGYRQLGMRQLMPFYLLLHAYALRHAGSLQEGMEVLAEALSEIDATGERWCEAEVHRFRGELLLTTDKIRFREAQASLIEAIDLARKQGAKLWELRAATTLAKHHHYEGRHTEARELLGPIYDWFTEGFDMPDLQEAKDLLRQLDQ
jgi:predicted ATPase